MPELPISADFYYAFEVTTPSGAIKPGLRDLQLAVSDTNTVPVTPVTPALIYPAPETSTSGLYATTIESSDMTAAFTEADIGRPVWLLVIEGVEIYGAEQFYIAMSPRLAPT